MDQTVGYMFITLYPFLGSCDRQSGLLLLAAIEFPAIASLRIKPVLEFGLNLGISCLWLLSYVKGMAARKEHLAIYFAAIPFT